jgi:glycosyltransferase 2 family protein
MEGGLPMKRAEAVGEALTGSATREPRQRALFYLKLLVSIGLLAAIVWRADLAEVWLALRETNSLLIVAAAALNPVGGTLTALRWHGLLRSQGVDAPLYRLIQSCIIASFFRQFLPSTIGGDAIRAYDSWKMGASKTVAVSTLAVDRVFGLVILLLFAVIAILFSPRVLPEIPLLPMWIALGAGCLFSLLLLIFLPGARLFRPLASIVERLPRPIGDVVNMLSGSLVGFRGQPGLMLRSLGLSFLLQLNVVFFYVLIGTALGLSVPLLAYFIFVPLATIVMMLPVSINAIGLREAVFVVLLGAFGVSMAEALAFAWLEYGLFLFYGLVGGVLYALRR